MKYIIKITEGKGIIPIPKNGSLSLAQEIARQQNLKVYPAGSVVDAAVLRTPYKGEPIELHAIIREPVARFKSLVKSFDLTVDELLDRMEDNLAWFEKTRHLRYLFQHQCLVGGTHLYRLDADKLEIEEFLGGEFEHTHISDKEDIPLTFDQLNQVKSVFADDITLYKSITEAGQTYTPPPEPATDELKAAKIRELESSRYQAEVAGITLPDGKFVRTDKETQAELGKALSIISTVNPALEIDWKFPDGEVVHLDATQIQEIAGVVFTHVQVTRTTHKDKAAEVEAATTKDELDAITW